MAEVNQVPETAVSPEIVDHFPRPSAEPPTRTFLRAPDPADDAYRDSPKGRVAEWMRGRGLNADFDLPLLGRPLAPTEGDLQYYRDPLADRSAIGKLSHAYYDAIGVRLDDPAYLQVLGPLAAVAQAPVTPSGAAKKLATRGTATVGRLIAKSLPRDARALATYANDLSRAAAVLSKADVAATPNAAAALRKVMYRGEKGGPSALKTWFFGGTPSAERTINMAYAKKMGGQSPMSDEMADHIVKAADKLSAEISTALKSPRGAAKADTTKLKAAMVALSSELKSGAEAYRSRGVWNMAKDSGGWVGGKLKAAAASASGVRRYKAGSMKASRSIFGFAGSLADWGLSKIPGISPAALDTAQKYIGGTLGATPLGVASAGAIVGLYDKLTKPSRDEAGAAAGDATAAEAYRRAYGAEPPKATTPMAPAATPAPAAPAPPPLKAAFFF